LGAAIYESLFLIGKIGLKHLPNTAHSPSAKADGNEKKPKSSVLDHDPASLQFEPLSGDLFVARGDA
jgi:hypothetical protein